MKLRDIAHTRAGDKGDTSNISVIAFDAKDYPRLEAQMTTAKVRAYLSDIVKGGVVRYTLPKIGALNFVMEHALGGGVTRSLCQDAHGKSLSSALLNFPIE